MTQTEFIERVRDETPGFDLGDDTQLERTLLDVLHLLQPYSGRTGTQVTDLSAYSHNELLVAVYYCAYLRLSARAVAHNASGGQGAEKRIKADVVEIEYQRPDEGGSLSMKGGESVLSLLLMKVCSAASTLRWSLTICDDLYARQGRDMNGGTVGKPLRVVRR